MDRFTAFVLKVCGALTALGISSTLALLFWVGQQIVLLQNQVERLQEQASGLYTARQAERDLSAINQRLDEHERRLNEIERGGGE